MCRHCWAERPNHGHNPWHEGWRKALWTAAVIAVTAAAIVGIWRSTAPAAEIERIERLLRLNGG